jgi:hypothetical protein
LVQSLQLCWRIDSLRFVELSSTRKTPMGLCCDPNQPDAVEPLMNVPLISGDVESAPGSAAIRELNIRDDQRRHTRRRRNMMTQMKSTGFAAL